MPIKSEDIHTLTEWLGAEGAVAGLDRSELTNSELMMLARNNGINMDSKAPRRQIVIELVMAPLDRIDKNIDDLLEMSREELSRYLSDRLVSGVELKRLLDGLGIPPKGKLRSKLAEFAASEISDLGMYQRVAKGHSKSQ
jgi:fructose-specific phosphotransferase system component IIB